MGVFMFPRSADEPAKSPDSTYDVQTIATITFGVFAALLGVAGLAVKYCNGGTPSNASAVEVATMCAYHASGPLTCIALR